MMVAVLILLIWDQHKLLPIVGYNKISNVKHYPDPARQWIVAGIVYAISFIVLYLLGPAGTNVYTLWGSRVLGTIILLTFVISNYKAYKNRKMILNT